MSKTLDLLTRKEAAALLRITVRTLERLAADGKLRRTKIRGKVLIERSEIERLVREGSDATAA
jgi:excisionase family DNA binding protein